MPSIDRNYIIMGLILGVTSIFSLCFYFQDFKQTDTVQIKNFPRTIGAWASEDIPITSQEQAILETDNAFVRRYTNPNGEVVYLYIVYSQTNHKVAHPPEICYTGSGVSILQKTHDPIAVSYRNLTIHTNRLLLQANGFYQISFYWFKVGDTFTSNYWKQQALVALGTLFGKREGSALIRISSDIHNKDQQKAIQTVKDFTNLITPQLFKFLP